MVFFNCNACGETLKRNKVDIHYKTKCRNCEVVSCVDCSKEFWGDEYKKHMACISEEEKYSGSNYVAKPNKGEVKQELWQKSIEEAVEKNKQNPKLQDLLTRLIEHPNIPRKRKKFENFMRSSFGVRDNKCIAQIWEIISENTNNNTKEKEEVTNENVNGKISNSPTINSDKCEKLTTENTNIENGKKLSKREKKEERKLKHDKKEKKDKHKIVEDIKVTKHKKRKRKNEESDEEEGENVNKKRKHSEEDDVVDEVSEEEEEEEEEEKPVKKRKIKFNWEQIIIKILETKGEEIPLKKLRKKVLAEYASQGGCLETQDELCAKFNTKLMKNPKFKVLKERVKLSKAR